MTLKIATAQINCLVGDVQANTDLVIKSAKKALKQHADMIVFPELTLTGYPPEDLLLRNKLHQQVAKALDHICALKLPITLIIGYPRKQNKKLYNSAGVIQKGRIMLEYDKAKLPNYSVFDERRYFKVGKKTALFKIKQYLIGITICEDIWFKKPAKEAKKAGADILINMNASPYHLGKAHARRKQVVARSKQNQLPIIYANLVGGQDELVFDGGSFVTDKKGKIVQQNRYFQSQLSYIAFNKKQQPIKSKITSTSSENKQIFQALVLGTRDYVHKNGFHGAVLGLSGGIDSALTLAIAVEALGANQVEVVLMPSRYTANISNTDAIKQAQLLGVKYRTITIEPAFNAFLTLLKTEFAGTKIDTSEENIQARCRGIILMAISNKKGKILLTTGNKSEMSVGYATLYGDMAGGYAPIKDLYKTKVYQLAKWLNRKQEIIPNRVITRPPSAELAPDQKDSDSLPDYAILDGILKRFVEQDQSIEKIIQAGYDKDIVKRIALMVDRNEYKRRQAPPGIKITPRAFGRDRRYPLSSGFNQ